MTNVRNILIGLVVSALLTGIIVSCGGGGGGGYGGGGGGGGGYGGGMAGYTVGGTLSGATGSVVLKLNGGSDMTVPNGSFTFATRVDYLITYNVQVIDASDRCTVTNGAGTMGTANVMNVAVNCVAPAGEKVVRSTGLSGAQENPAVVTSASGTGGIIFDPGTNGITGGVTVYGLTPASVGIFQAPSGSPTGNSTIPAIVTLSSAGDGLTFFIPAGTTLTAGQITSLRAGELYFNVITAAQSAGEIRGQINLQGGVLAGVSGMDFPQEVVDPADVTCTSSTATGQGTVIVDRATHAILISYMTHNVVNANMSHIHTSVNTNPPCSGGPACNGPVIVNFNTGAALNYPAAGAMLTNMTDFLANYLYFNIHSSLKCPGGEIRGNITALQ